jgi:hypothetical protein
MYTSTDYNIRGAFPLPFSFPFADSPCPLAPLSDPLLLTWNPPSCDRIRPPWSQVACKLTSPFPKPSPLQIPRTQDAQRLTETTSRWIRRLQTGTLNVQVILNAQTQHTGVFFLTIQGSFLKKLTYNPNGKVLGSVGTYTPLKISF